MKGKGLGRSIAAGFLISFGAPAASAVANQPADDLSTFVTTYHCTVAELLARIHAHLHPEQKGRFLILENAITHQYVQCLFVDRDKQMLCEAWSGWWDKKGNGPNFKPNIPPHGLQALAKLGFSMDASHGNFQHLIRFQDIPDYGGAADLMLSALYSGYGTRIEAGVGAYGPYATRRGLLRKNRCVPVS